jgi:hypothetical protein
VDLAKPSSFNKVRTTIKVAQSYRHKLSTVVVLVAALEINPGQERLAGDEATIVLSKDCHNALVIAGAGGCAVTGDDQVRCNPERMGGG